MNIEFIKSSEKKKILAALEEQYGITELPYLLIKSGKEKIRAYSGSLSKDEISMLKELAHIETIGLYAIKQEHDFRLTMDIQHLLKEQIIKNILVLSEQEFKDWIRGIDLQIKKDRGTYAISYNNDFFGCGKSNGSTIFNYVPKDRRLKR